MFQYRRVIDETIQLWSNTTTVPDFHDPPGADIPPYPRSAHAGSAGDPWLCDDGPPGDCPCFVASPPYDCGGVGQATCGTWPSADRTNCGTDDATHFSTDNNCYAKQDGQTVDLSKCRKLGFKNVQASKLWHGCFGYLSHDRAPFGDNDRGTLLDGTCSDCFIEYEQPNQDQTKYLQAQMVGTRVVTGAGPGSYSSQMTVTVDRLSGVRTVSDCTTDAIADDVRDTGWGVSQLSLYSSWDAMAAFFPNGCPAGPNCSFTTGDGTTLTFDAYDACTGASDPCATGGNHVCHAVMNIETMTFDRYDYTLYGGVLVPSFEEHWSCSNTSFTHTKKAWFYSPGHDSVTIDTTTGTLSVPYSATDLYDDWVDLQNEWDLTDDRVYPWRTDSYLSVAPLVSRNESGPNSPDENLGCAYVADLTLLPKANMAPGAIIGAPLPAGYGPHFDWDHRTWTKCTDTHGNDLYYIKWYGAWCHTAGGTGDPTDRVVPMTATQWTENYPIPGTAPAGGAWLFYRMSGWPQALIGQKWAEIKIIRPSYNFARPCGQDRYAIVEGTAQCVESVSGSGPYTLTLQAALSWTPAGSDPVLVRSVEGVPDGVYTLTSHSGASVTITGPAVMSPNWDAPPDLAPGFVAKLRFPTAPAICGQAKVSNATPSGAINVTAATNASPIRITTAIPGQWIDGQSVIIAGSLGNTAANGTHTITVIGPQDFLLNGTTGNGAYTGSGQVTGPIVLTVDDTQALANGDSVVVASVGGNTNANGTKTVTVIDGTHLSLNSTSANGAYTSGGTVSISGAANVEWNDDGSKGQFVYAEWTCNLRDWQERDRVNAQYITCDSCAAAAPADATLIRHNQTLHCMPQYVSGLTIMQKCLPIKVCTPAVMAITPNGEVFDNGLTMPFSPLMADERYGSQWQAAFIQHVPDYLWEPKHSPCVVGLTENRPTNCAFIEDDGGCSYGPDGGAAGGAFCGNCIEEGDDFAATNPPATPQLNYAQRPWKEALVGLPSNASTGDTAPALPAGLYVGWLRLSDLDTATIVAGTDCGIAGNVLIPVEPAGYGDCSPDIICAPREVFTHWGLWLNEMFCVCGNGCFKDDYLADRIPPCR